LLNVADQFGEAAYELRAGQHVLFEHASLKEVVDHESSSCGCPPAQTTMSVADALLHPVAPGEAATAEKPAAEQHPFPAAVSAGLAPPTVVPQAPAGAAHTQVSAALSSGEGVDSVAEPGAATEKAPPSAPAPSAAAAPQVAPPQTAPPKHDLAHAVGRFFKRIFGRG
jgi:hypothetical protein